MRSFLNRNRHQTVTKTEYPDGVPRKSCRVTHLGVRRAGIEPATYEFKGIALSQLIRGFPRRIISESVRIARKARESVLGDRNANVIANRPFGQLQRAELERAVREDLRQLSFRRWN